MESLIIFVHILAAIAVIGLVLLQQGKGADVGASFGGGASQTIFGSVGSGNVLTRSTAWLATIFFATSLLLALYARQQVSSTVDDDGLISDASALATTPPLVNDDLPNLPDAASDIPVAPEGAAATVDAPVVDEALQAAAEQAATLANEQADPAAAAAVEPENLPEEVPAQ